MDFMGVIAFVGALIPLIRMIYTEYLSDKAEAKRRNEEFKLDQQKFLRYVETATLNMRKTIADENRDDRDAQDRVDLP